jgi:hypothetical protein
VFISHSSIDTWVAAQVAREVSAAGATPFLDEANISVGEDFKERILEALREAKELVVLLTPWSLGRAYIWAETGVAWGRGIPIVGLLHGLTPGDLQANSNVPFYLKSRNLIQLNNVGIYFNDLRARIEASNEMQ